MNKIQKDRNLTSTSKVQEQKQDTVQDPQTPSRWADHPSQPSSLTHQPSGFLRGFSRPTATREASKRKGKHQQSEPRRTLYFPYFDDLSEPKSSASWLCSSRREQCHSTWAWRRGVYHSKCPTLKRNREDLPTHLPGETPQLEDVGQRD